MDKVIEGEKGSSQENRERPASLRTSHSQKKILKEPSALSGLVFRLLGWAIQILLGISEDTEECY